MKLKVSASGRAINRESTKKDLGTQRLDLEGEDEAVNGQKATVSVPTVTGTVTRQISDEQPSDKLLENLVAVTRIERVTRGL